ncbi:hypothetical protein M9H77_22634 [Catharanthus roseus]|uniref:Uncharacterized protein n=1 Tax=Catharanthus roseus TaxID=4058 RepID=A0ACC0ARF2_CATRO|nr:hypothetical protein M9H77_22634 [Catharanthus roseus]
MLSLQDLRRSSCNRLSSSERVMFHLAIYYDFSENKTLVVQLGLDLSSIVFWDRYNEPGKERTFCFEAVAINMSRLKEKYGVKNNPIVKNLSNKISHLGLKKIMDELKKARQMVEEPGKIGSDIPEEYDRDMESEIRDLTSLLQEISTSSISNVQEVRRHIKSVIHPMLSDDPCQSLSTPLETAVMKGRWKTNSTKMDKSQWEYVSIAHRKIGKSSGSSSRSGRGSGSGSNPSPRGRGRPPRSDRGRGRGQSSCRSSLSFIVSPDSLSVPFPFNNAFSGFMYQFYTKLEECSWRW